MSLVVNRFVARVAILVGLIGATVLAGAAVAPHTHAASRKADPPCSISPASVSMGQSYIVSVSGLPILSPINLVVTDAQGTTASPLGSTPDGTFNLSESSSVAGTTTYQFTGPFKNSNTTVYANCSVAVT